MTEQGKSNEVYRDETNWNAKLPSLSKFKLKLNWSVFRFEIKHTP